MARPHRFPMEKAAYLISGERRKKTDPEKFLDALEGCVGPLSGKKVADIGCGPGFFTIPLARRVGSGGKVWAVDVEKGVLDMLLEHIPPGMEDRIETVHSAVDRIPLPDGVTDGVLLINIFHEIRGTATLDEVDRILSPGGFMVVRDWDMVETPHGPPLSERVPPDRVGEILEELSRGRGGYEKTAVLPDKRDHYTLVFRKQSLDL
ncbi:MAG: methyltransferase domain-containing protein [Thermoplasmata archaeon]|nr:methyltransferase domain-containing protein [Thermoplasmata archaeon]